MAKTYRPYTNTGDSVTGWPKNQTRYYVADSAKSCSVQAAEFAALTLAQKIAQTVTTVPSATSGKKWDPRACAVAGDTFVDIDNSAFEPEPTGGGNPTETGFDTSYSFSRSGQDYNGKAFVSSPAPALTPVVQTKPRLRGNFYNLTWQDSLNVALFKRFPVFTMLNKIIVYPGGLYTMTADNDVIGRGFTHVAESTKFTGESVYPTQYKRAIEAAFYHEAWQAGKELESSNPTAAQQLFDWSSRSSNGPDNGYHGTHIFIENEVAWNKYAEKIYALLQQPDWKGGGVEYFSLNMEINEGRPGSSYSPYAQWYRQIGGIAKHLIEYAATQGQANLKTCLTDHGGICHPSPYFFCYPYNGDNSLPEYMHVSRILEGLRGNSQSDPISNSTIIGQLLRQGKAFGGENSYLQHTNDGQTLFQKNGADYIVQNGELVWRTDKRNVNLHGQNTIIYKGDYYRAIVKMYAFEAQDVANNFFRAGGQHLAASNYRPTGYENITFSTAYRLDTEHESGLDPGANNLTTDEVEELNNRPLYGPWTENYAIRMYFFATYIRGWMETQPRTQLGGVMTNRSKYGGSVEMYQKGFQRAANLNFIIQNGYQPLEFKHWIFKNELDQTTDKYEQFYRKPVVRGGLFTYQGDFYIWVRICYLCQDEDKFTDFKFWIDKGSGAVTPSYQLRAEGRNPVLEYWKLPAGAVGAVSKDVYCQFKDILPAPYQETHTWRGDYREARITSNPTPPALVS